MKLTTHTVVYRSLKLRALQRFLNQCLYDVNLTVRPLVRKRFTVVLRFFSSRPFRYLYSTWLKAPFCKGDLSLSK